jgi:hypothetical protein
MPPIEWPASRANAPASEPQTGRSDGDTDRGIPVPPPLGGGHSDDNHDPDDPDEPDETAFPLGGREEEAARRQASSDLLFLECAREAEQPAPSIALVAALLAVADDGALSRRRRQASAPLAATRRLSD